MDNKIRKALNKADWEYQETRNVFKTAKLSFDLASEEYPEAFEAFTTFFRAEKAYLEAGKLSGEALKSYYNKEYNNG